MNPATTESESLHLIALSDSERLLLSGLLAHYRHMMLIDLKKGALTEHGIRRYRQDLAESGGIMVKLGGRS